MEKQFEICTERGKTFTRLQCRWESVPNVGCSNREGTLAQVQFSSGTMNCCEVHDMCCAGMLEKSRRLASAIRLYNQLYSG